MTDTAEEQWNTMNDERRTVNDNDTLRQAEKHRATQNIKTQHYGQKSALGRKMLCC